MVKPRSAHPLLDRLAWVLALLYGFDRLLKLLAVAVFFRRPPPADPIVWPSVTLICPISRSPNNLSRILQARARLDYPGPQHTLLICDRADTASQAICREVMAECPTWRAELLLVEPDAGAVASKVAKQCAALPRAGGEVLCFVDDDVLLRPDALQVLVPWAVGSGVGAAFGLACYTAWGTLAESLMSGFVNSSALLSYVPLAFIVQPFTITGHCFAMPRERFEAIGGLSGMAGRIDDDHELARRVRRHGLRNVQTPLIYDVENRLSSLADYHGQMRRWMLIPRQAMLPTLGAHDRGAMLACSIGPLLPPLLVLLALTRRPAALRALGLSAAGFAAAHALIERVYLQRPMPARRWPLLPLLAYVTPIHVALAALGGETVSWRGQRLRVEPGGRYTVLDEEN
jgi:ceramide glucosyltransferase